jgi:hypothetical protein
MSDKKDTFTPEELEIARLARIEYQAKWREKNRKHLRAYQKAYREKNREKIREYQRRWQQKNPSKVFVYQTRQFLKLAKEQAKEDQE